MRRIPSVSNPRRAAQLRLRHLLLLGLAASLAATAPASAVKRRAFTTSVTGTDEFGVVDSGQHCLDWTSTGSGNGLVAGSAALSRSGRWTSTAATNCASAQGSLYCFSNVVTLFWDGFDSTGDASRWSTSVP